MIEEPINDHAGEGDVEPDRERETGDFRVPFKLAFQGTGERQKRQGDRRHGQDRMREKNRKINGPNPALAEKGCGAVEIMVGKV